MVVDFCLEVSPPVEAMALEVLRRRQGKAPGIGELLRSGLGQGCRELDERRGTQGQGAAGASTGVGPVRRRHLDKLTRGAVAGTTFDMVARELHAVKKRGWSEKYAARWIERMEGSLSVGIFQASFDLRRSWPGPLPLRCRREV